MTREQMIDEAVREAAGGSWPAVLRECAQQPVPCKWRISAKDVRAAYRLILSAELQSMVSAALGMVQVYAVGTLAFAGCAGI